MGKPKQKIKKIIERVNREPLHKVKALDKIERDKLELFRIKKLNKQRMILKTVNSSLIAECKIIQVHEWGYILKIIKHPTNEVNSEYGVGDLIEYFTFNESYVIGDIVEYKFVAPNNKSSKLLVGVVGGGGE